MGSGCVLGHVFKAPADAFRLCSSPLGPACAQPQGQPEVRDQGPLMSLPVMCTALHMHVGFQILRNMSETFKALRGYLIPQVFLLSVLVSLLLVPRYLQCGIPTDCFQNVLRRTTVCTEQMKTYSGNECGVHLIKYR